MIQLKINGEWKNADKKSCFFNANTLETYYVCDIQDIRAFGADYSYEELLQLSHADIEQKMQQNNTSRLEKLEDTLRKVITALDVREDVVKNNEGEMIDAAYSSTVIGNLIDRVNSLETKTAKMNKLYNIIKEINNNEN